MNLNVTLKLLLNLQSQIMTYFPSFNICSKSAGTLQSTNQHLCHQSLVHPHNDLCLTSLLFEYLQQVNRHLARYQPASLSSESSATSFSSSVDEHPVYTEELEQVQHGPILGILGDFDVWSSTIPTVEAVNSIIDLPTPWVWNIQLYCWSSIMNMPDSC